jgi:hypothetical protein
LQFWDGKAWLPVPRQARVPEKPTGHRANWIRFPELKTTRIRAVFTHQPGGRTGLTEFEAWGDSLGPVEPAPPPTGNLAFNAGGKPFPKVSASFTSRFDKVEWANDGKISFSPSPHNRWTSYESPNASDWLAIDFGKVQRIGRVELAIYDDHGGVQAPASYMVQVWNGESWQEVIDQKKTPEAPTGGQFNEVVFAPVQGSRLRVVFTHRGKARSGLTEILVWEE